SERRGSGRGAVFAEGAHGRRRRRFCLVERRFQALDFVSSNLMSVMGTPFDRVECPTATLGIGNIVVIDPSPRFMRPYDAGVRDGDPVTLLIEEGNDFELVEATAQNCSAQH